MLTYLIAVCFKEILMSSSWRWRDNGAETLRCYGKDCTPKLENGAFVGVTW